MSERKAPVRSRSAGEGEDPAGTRTRDRILDIALDLFIEKGFDKSSLREIAEQLGISKAAIYYHFASKDEILMALHLRLHEIGRRAIAQLGQLPTGMETWTALLDELVGEMFAHRKIFVMHDRNRSVFEQLHRREHEAEHEDLNEEVRRVMSDRSLPLRDRVRFGCAVGAMLSTLIIYGDLLQDAPAEELEALLRDAVGDVLGRRVRRGRAPRPRSAAIGSEDGSRKPPVRRRPRPSRGGAR